jgi:peptidyl-prolyl cis-trans isomerase D
VLNFMRKNAKSWFVTLIIGAIVVVFVLWGIGTFRSAQFQKVAEVDGVKIVLPEYLRAYQNLMRTYQERLGSDFNEEAVKALNLKAQTLNQLIDEVLIQQASKRLGLVVTDAELRNYIQKIPAFADERGFNEKRYQQLLARQRLPASDFEAMERQRLLMQKVVGFITAFAKVSDADLQETYRLEQEAVRVAYLSVGPSTFLKQQQASPAEVEAFYDSHQEFFREPEKFQIRYTFLKFRDLGAKIKPDLKKMEAFFYDHLDEFSQPQTIRVNEILLEIPKQATAADRQQLRQQAETILRSAKAGVKFDQLVKKYAQIPGLQIKAEDSGVVKRGQKTPEWENAAFKLKKGEFGLAATPDRFHILLVTDIVENKAPTFASVQSQVERAWRENEAMQLAQQQAAELRAEMLNSSFEATVKQRQLAVQETPLLSAQESIPMLGVQPAISQAALKLKPQEVSKPIIFNDGIVILQVVNRRESVVPPLAQIKDRVAEAARLDKAKEAALQEARKMLVRLQKGEPLTKLASQMGLTVQDSGFFTRPQGFPGHPQARSLTTAAFTLTASHPYPDELITLNGENFLLAFKERRQPDPEHFAQAKDQMQQALLDLKRQMVFSQWLAEERRRAKIKVYELPS